MMWNLIRWLCQKPDDLNLQCFQKKINLGSAGQVLFCFVFVALRSKSTAMVIAGRSVHLTIRFPGQA